METKESMNIRSDSFYSSTHVLHSPMEWMELRFRVHKGGHSVDLWITNTRDETAAVTIHIPVEIEKEWCFNDRFFLLHPDQNGIEGSPNNNFCIDFCRWLWAYLQKESHWTPKTGGKQP